MAEGIGLVGFGEAAQAFAGAPGWSTPVLAYDRLTDDPATLPAKLAEYQMLGVEAAASLAAVVANSGLILSLVTADQALSVAMSAITLADGTLFCDMNSVSPGTKKAAAAAVEDRGGRYVDVAIMAPVNPKRLSVPLLLSGPFAQQAADRLAGLGFRDVRVIGGEVGDASAVKMIRSIIVKGIEALTAEAMIAAARAGVVDEVLASLEASERTLSWGARADYNLDRMIVHGLRRAEEMDEAVATLDALGVDPSLARATAGRQRAIGAMGLHPANGLAAKLDQLTAAKAATA